MAKVQQELGQGLPAAGAALSGAAPASAPGSVGPGRAESATRSRRRWPDVEHVPTALLVPRDRPARPPLPAWVGEVERALDEVPGADPDSGALAACFRQAARIERYFGRLHLAEALCGAHLQWVRDESARRGDPALLGLALDPWIELGRLDRLAGKEEASLRKLSRLPAARGSASIALGAVEIRAADWPAIRAARPGIDAALDTTWIVESLQTMLAAKSFQRALAFAAREARDPADDAASFLAEARIVVHCHLGRRDAAWDEAGRQAGDVNRSFRPIFQLRAAQALACFGGQRAALELLRDLVVQARGFRVAERPNTAKLHLLDQLTGLAASLGAAEVAAELGEAGLAGATHLRDEVLRASFLRRLADGNSRWRDEYEDLRKRTWYAGLRATTQTPDGPRSLAPDPGRIATVDRLTRRLLLWPRG